TGERLVVDEGPAPGPEPAAVADVPDGARVVTSSELRSGTRAWYHEELAGRRWRISARSFFQARPDGAEALVAEVVGALAGSLDAEAHLVDLYGGVGLFAGSVGSGSVTLVESSASAVADARVNLADRSARIVKA